MYTYYKSHQLYPYIHAYKNVHKHPVYKSQRNRKQLLHYYKKNRYIHCIIFTQEYNIAVKKQITAKCSNTIFPSGT